MGKRVDCKLFSRLCLLPFGSNVATDLTCLVLFSQQESQSQNLTQKYWTIHLEHVHFGSDRTKRGAEIRIRGPGCTCLCWTYQTLADTSPIDPQAPLTLNVETETWADSKNVLLQSFGSLGLIHIGWRQDGLFFLLICKWENEIGNIQFVSDTTF